MAAPHSHRSSVIGRQKAELRARMIALRATLDPALGGPLAEHVLRDVTLPPAARVAGIWPLPGEIDLRPLWHALHGSGRTVLLPQTTPRGEILQFRRWHPECVMVRERFGTECPDGDLAIPEIIFVPLLAFDRRGHRLGYGGGYYDRTLAAYPDIPAIGFGYAAQEVEKIPCAEHDRQLQAVFTELGKVVLKI
jgi:5-formyltetrahydrofolate cyclo-ligase